MNISLRQFRFFAIVITFLAGCISSFAQQSHTIRLKSGSIYAAANAEHWLDSFSAAPHSDPAQVLMHFNTLPDNDQREALRQNGITLLDYIPDNTFVALVQPSFDKNAVLATSVHSFAIMKPEMKADSYLWKQVKNKRGAVEVLVSFYSNVNQSAIQSLIKSLGGTIDHAPMEKYGAYKVIVDAAKVTAVAQWYGVRGISPVSGIVPLDLDSRPSVKGNVSLSSLANGGYGLKGDSVTVGVGDDASGIYHADLYDRITNFNPAPHSNHGEHVNGIVGGAGNLDPLAESTAPHVALLDYLYDLILPATGDMYRDYNMTITNNSYEVIAGDCDYAGTYDVYSQLVDTLSVQYPNVLHVFASGNDGYLTCSPYLPGFGTVGGGYQPAKNNVVVGSMTDFYEDVSDESRGPVLDGRLKPEIEATGLVVYSTVGIDQYEWAAGTSMAAPQIASGLAGLTQRYKQLHAGAQPRADLLKTILLNGAMDLGNPGPDYSHGFGEMDMNRSLQILNNNNYTVNDIANGDSQSFTITVPPGTGQLKVMLYWADPPASPSSAKQLVNDLDLTVSDVSGTKHLPLILDPSPANVNNNAVEGADHTNNIEQVTINNPASGAYTVKTKGYSIPYGPQHYVVAYDFIPKALQLTYPLGGEQLLSSGTPFDTVRIFWDACTDGNTFKVEVSQDNGANWITFSDTVAVNERHYGFLPAGLSTGNMRVRVSRNGTAEVQTSGRFSINAQPILAVDTAQCPGYLNIHWSPVLNASGYYLLRKIGAYMQVVDSTTDTTYTFRNMPLNAYSYVVVQPIIDGVPGYRSIALKAMANTGNCTLPISNGDLMIEKVVAPTNGRMYTSSQLTSSDTIKLLLGDLYRADCDSYRLSWQVNSGAWQSIISATVISAGGSVIASIPGINLSTPGSYAIRVAVHNLSAVDPQPANDSLSFTVLNILNDTISLTGPFLDDFESMPVLSVIHDSVGVSPNGHWDFFSANDSGRMRTFVADNISIGGHRSISLDAYERLVSGSGNTFVGTFNLSNYDTAVAEVRVDFDYILHGTPKSPAGNVVVARATDTVAWSPFYTYDLSAYPGYVTSIRSLSLTDAVRLSHRNFSSATQVSFGQSDTSLIATIDYGNGITLDNFRMYTVVNDAELVSIVSPEPNNCGLPSPGPLTVQVRNGVNYTLHNVHLFYTVDGGSVFTGVIDSIPAKATVNYTFSQELTMALGTTHSLNVWLNEAGDSYPANDSILNYQFRNSEIINSYPYLENFESGDGGYYSGGFRDSWQYGTPASRKINKAASGIKAWKTNLTGNYNDLELSYLYSPCFDLSGLNRPMISFSVALDIENCGRTLCDAAYLEASYDGVSWSKVGTAGQGTNWYDSTFDVWNTEGFTRWHVASYFLPQPGPGYTTHLRFVMAADPGATFEGIAVDDIHIFDYANPIYQGPLPGVATQNASGNQWVNVLQPAGVLTSLQPANQALNATTVNLYGHDTLYNPGATQYTFPRSYTIRSLPAPSDSVGVRLYLLDSDVVAVTSDTTCPSCTPVPDAYRLGITKFDNTGHPALEDSTLSNDTGGTFTYYPYQSVAWVPYDKGYYAEIKSSPFSEYWFNNGGPTASIPAGVDYVSFVAYRNGSDVTCQWHSLIDTSVNVYIVEWSLDAVHFALADSTPARHQPIADYSFNDPVNFGHYPVFYYRLKWTMLGSDALYYSPIRRVDSSDSASSLITFTARTVSHTSVLLNWTSYIDGGATHYALERAIGDGPFGLIDDAPAQHHVSQQYSFIDQPANLRTGTLLHYRLTADMNDGSSVVLPDQSVEWINANTFTDLFPNPSHDGRFTINWFADPGTNMQVIVTDMSGRSIYRTAVASTQWNNNTSLQLPRLPSGVYSVTMIIGGTKYCASLVIE